MGVSPSGKVYYRKEFIESKAEHEVEFILCHEVLHLALQHLTRRAGRDPVIWNVAADIVANNLLLQDNFPAINGIITEFRDVEVENRAVEPIYDDLFKRCKKIRIGKKGKREGGKAEKDDYSAIREADSQRFDQHLEEEKTQEEDTSIVDRREDIDWERVTREAYVYAKQQGKLPGGLEQLLDGLLEKQVNWRVLLYQFITKEIPIDYSWKRPHKRSIPTEVYLPMVKKENIDIIVAIDSSGSISNGLYRTFMTEVVSVLNSFDGITGTLLECDADIHQVREIDDRFKAELSSGKATFKRIGYGGTSFIPVFEWIKDNKPRAKVLIYLTDGYGSFPEKQPQIPTLWVVCEGGLEEEQFPFGRVVRIVGEAK